MSAILDNLTIEEQTLMVQREILAQLKLIAAVLEEVHDTGITIDDTEA